MTAGVKVCGDQLMDYYREKSILSKIPKIISIFSEICIRINVDPRPSDILSNSYWAVILSDCHYQPCTLSKLWENEGRQYKKMNIMEHLINQVIRHSLWLTFILPVKMEISKEGSTILACLSCFFSGKGNSILSTVSVLFTSQRNLFENTITAVQALKSWPDMIWHLWVSQFLQCQNRTMSKYCQVINNVQHIKGTERRFKIGLSPIPEIAEENLSMKSFYLRCSHVSHQMILKQGTTTADDQM